MEVTAVSRPDRFTTWKRARGTQDWMLGGAQS